MNSILNYVAIAVTTLISVGIGLLFSEIGSWFKIRREDNRNKKKVLFYLLETLHAFQKLDISDDLERLSKKISAKIPGEMNHTDAGRIIHSILSSIIPKIIEKAALKDLKETEDSYKKCIEELSIIDPIVAYKLKGKNKIIDVFDQLGEYVSQFSNKHPGESGNGLNSIDLIDLIKPEVIQASIGDLRIEISNLSRDIGRKTYKNTKRIVYKDSTSQTLEQSTEEDEMLERLFSQLVKAIPME